MGVVAGQAADAVAHARRRLRQILDDFEAVASALEPRLDSPGVAHELLAEAREALHQAITVVEALLGELDRQAAALDTHTAGAAPTVPAASGTPAAPGAGGWGAETPGGWGGGSPGTYGGAGVGTSGGGAGEWAAFTHGADTPDAANFGEGVEIRLPDGSVVLAPNAAAAAAVRHALTQLGVPYQWGGTTPGVGLDCSGLTQWAYREAGLNIPRLAQEQDIGAAVAPGDLRPGDLAVWDGHVAMVVGNNLMIEAGDPVKLSPIRTSNAGQGFQGFWRPTA
ncbi:NLP/P60-family secreted protein [Mycobacterium sp. PO1]|nr:NLP/P60-family secreted protein [Mycobacterium sp. PO1]GFM22422.1 NLP/P60-family secreted protein [Mycobacterium sp. PO2]